MLTLGIQEFAELVGGTLDFSSMRPLGGELEPVGRIVHDLSEVGEDDLFWCCETNREEACQQVAKAYGQGAQGVVSSFPITPWAGRFCICVEDSRWALWKAARWGRSHIREGAVAVAGAAGKSTATAMIASVLGLPVPSDSMRDEAGVSIEVINSAMADQLLLVELHDDPPGRFMAQTQLVQPDVALITHVSSRRPWITNSPELSWVREFAECEATLIYNCDDSVLFEEFRSYPALTFGRSASANFVIDHVRHDQGCLQFEIERQKISLPAWGRHLLGPASGAYVIGRMYGLSRGEIAQKLAQVQTLPHRCQLRFASTFSLIDDTYDATPADFAAALSLLAETKSAGRKILVCTDLHVPVQDARPAHEWLGKSVVTRGGADALLVCGEHALTVQDAAIAAGMNASHVHVAKSNAELHDTLLRIAQTQDLVLLKGNRASGLSQLASKLIGEADATPWRRAA